MAVGLKPFLQRRMTHVGAGELCCVTQKKGRETRRKGGVGEGETETQTQRHRERHTEAERDPHAEK